MAPSEYSPNSRLDADDFPQSGQSSRNSALSRSALSAPQRLRNEAESWVEISSQPSSSSLSSIGDEIVTTGLRVQHDTSRRRRRHQPGPVRLRMQGRTTSTSSQEEYEESDSDDDRVMTSSTEHIQPPLSSLARNAQRQQIESDDDENATALGGFRRDEAVFTPQPNAFSHPPVHRQMTAESYFPRPPFSHRRPSHHNRPASRQQHTPFSAMSPSFRAEHDAALRASLTTLLSLGAAARSLPKRTQPNASPPTAPSRTEPTALRLVPESEVVEPSSAPSRSLSRRRSPSTRTQSNQSVASQDAENGKRKAATGARSVSRATKKKKTSASAQDSLISPTLLTWLVSAGVIVVFSVVGFGAGYAMGKEAGRQEALSGLGVDSTCGGEVVRGSGGLRKLRWAGTAGRLVAV